MCGIGAAADGGFEAHTVAWRTATVFFAVIDLVAAVGLWLAAPWGAVVWLTSVVSMAVVEVFFPQVYGGSIYIVLIRGCAAGALSVARDFCRARAAGVTARREFMPQLSAIVITKNEAANIGECLDSLAFCDERIVVDCGSTDATVEIARAKGARVEFHEWRGFGPQKNYALSLANGTWVFSLDADETRHLRARRRDQGRDG